jgi:hypothetical protein
MVGYVATVGTVLLICRRAPSVSYYGGGFEPPSSSLGGGWQHGGMFVRIEE